MTQTIDYRIRVIAMRRRPVTAPCAIRQLSEQAQQNFYFRRLMFEYQSLPDDEKDKWLNEQEAT